MASSGDVTKMLHALGAGDRSGFDDLLARVYDELRVLAHAQLRNERSDHTLATTDLVHEAYLRLVDHQQMDWKNRAHFFAGLTIHETAEALGISHATVSEDWRLARAWLRKALSNGA